MIMIKMLYNRCMAIYKFGNNTYPQRIRCRSNLGHIFQEKSAFYGLGNTVCGPIKNVWPHFLSFKQEVGCMWPWTSMHVSELLPSAWIAKSLAFGKNLLLCVLWMSHWQWPRNLSSASASNFARNLGTHAQKPTIWFIRLLEMRQWAICKLWSGVSDSKRDGRQFRMMNVQGGPPQAGNNWWLMKCILSCWINRE
jgi:hypothetical protein